MTTILVILILNWLTHHFVMGVIDENPGNWFAEPIRKKWTYYILFIPPFAIIFAVLLVSLGFILIIFKK